MICSFSTIPLIRNDKPYQEWLDEVEETVREIGADVTVLPEYAWGRKPLTLKELEQMIKGRNWEGTVVAGTAVIDMADKKSNQAIVITEKGDLITIPKNSPMHHERAQGIIGMQDLKVVETKHGIKLGILICADLWHHSLVDAYLSIGIDMLAVPTMSVTLPNHEHYARMLWYSLAVTRSREFVLPIVVSDHPGTEKATTGFASAIVDPSVKNADIRTIEDFLELPDKTGVAKATIDFDKIREYRDYRIKEGLISQSLEEVVK